MHCTNCGTPLEASAAFCPNCGASVVAGPTPTPGSAGAAYAAGWQPAGVAVPAVGAPVPYGLVRDTAGRRVLGYLIDLVPMLLLSLLHLIPFFGWMLYGLIHVVYWLLRDMNGASIGKHVMRSVVLSEDGSPSTTNQRILRNVTLAVPGLLGMIPIIGLPFEFGAGFVIIVMEAVLLLATGNRLGDRLARTSVFRSV